MRHKHAELMKLYAEDAMETDKPWERWEYRGPSDRTWSDTCLHPIWDERWEYRRKPDQLEQDALAFERWWMDYQGIKSKYEINFSFSDTWHAALAWERSREKSE
jgi:hypothetical protein